MTRLEKALIVKGTIIWALFALFSYGYVDLNLTISQNPLILKFVSLMQQLGYFNRPTATIIYIALVTFTFSLFIFNLFLFYRRRVGLEYLKIATILQTLILIFAYPFLSSDLFNYMFDAKIILFYESNPYTHRALDFPSDEWIRFMRWVHRTSPYGPLWLGMSLFPAALGFGKFILSFFSFKIFIAAFHLLNSYLIYKTLNRAIPTPAIFGTAFYALNPLFLIEGVANSHNDVVFATFLISPIYFLLNNNKVGSYLSLFAGMAIKYISLLNLPWFLAFSKLAKLSTTRSLIWANLLSMAAFTILYSSIKITAPFVSSGSTQVQFQPWYLFWTIPFIALMPKVTLIVFATAICIAASLRYLPYLYYGDWSQPGTLTFMQLVTVIPPIVTAIIILAKRSHLTK